MSYRLAPFVTGHNIAVSTLTIAFLSGDPPLYPSASVLTDERWFTVAGETRES